MMPKSLLKSLTFYIHKIVLFSNLALSLVEPQTVKARSRPKALQIVACSHTISVTESSVQFSIRLRRKIDEK